MAAIDKLDKLLGDQCGEISRRSELDLVGEINIIHPLKKFFLVILRSKLRYER